MERKKRVVPREVCAVRLERGNHKAMLNALDRLQLTGQIF